MTRSSLGVWLRGGAIALLTALSVFTVVAWISSYRPSSLFPGTCIIEVRRITCTGDCVHLDRSFLGFGYEVEKPRGEHRFLLKWVWFPLWFAFVTFSAYPVLVLLQSIRRRSLRRRRVREGRCIGCGYDLTGNVSGRCPECGAAVPPAGYDADMETTK